MTVNTRRDGSVLILYPEGRLDAAAAPLLEQKALSELGDATKLVLDLSGVDYMSSAGLRTLRGLQTTMSGKGGMKLVNIQDAVRTVFQLTGFDQILQLEA